MCVVEYNGYTVVFADKSYAEKLGACKSAVALGNFDGVHIAHRELIRQAIKMKVDKGCHLVGAWSFKENPLEFFVAKPPKAIYSPDKKAEILLSCGLDFVVLADFGFFKDTLPEEFCEYLKKDIGAIGVVCGYNYRFGYGGKGDPSVLADAFGGVNTFVVGEIDHDGTPVSSTRIRGLIERGDIDTANKLLGKPFSLTAKVVHGKHLGRSLGYPTANQFFENGALIIKSGIYATRCRISGNTYIGVTNVGVRPTVEKTDNVNAETYILDFSGDIYGETIEVEFIEYLRDEMRFASLAELKDAISRDAEAARRTVKL